jgi:hypothetical protein
MSLLSRKAIFSLKMTFEKMSLSLVAKVFGMGLCMQFHKDMCLFFSKKLGSFSLGMMAMKVALKAHNTFPWVLELSKTFKRSSPNMSIKP